MGSTFGIGDRDDRRLHLSNGGTRVFLDVLALAACSAADSPFERRVALLLCESRLGMGNDDFDLDQLPWSGSDWQTEVAFLQRVVALARTRHRWNLLDYDPPYAEEYLAEYEQLLHDYQPSQTPDSPPPLWDPDPPPSAFTRCPEHTLYLGEYQTCRLCS